MLTVISGVRVVDCVQREGEFGVEGWREWVGWQGWCY